MDPSRRRPKKERHGWHCRGYLPHFDWPCTQFVTFRQFDSLPQVLLRRWRDELKHLPEKEREAEEARRVEAHIDRGTGSCVLKRPEIAAIIEEKLFECDGSRLDLKAWVVMPNHVHLLAGFKDEISMAKVIGDLKGSTAREINTILRKTGRSFWYRDYYDRFIRDAEHFANTRGYVHGNPVKAGLCNHFLDFPFSSARFLFERQEGHIYEVRRLNPALPVRDSNSRSEAEARVMDEGGHLSGAAE